MKHMVYSILKGRPLIVLGRSSHEKEIRMLVRALSIFVAGHHWKYPFIKDWKTDPISMSDLAVLKLVGIGRGESESTAEGRSATTGMSSGIGGKYGLSKVVERYVSVFWFEEEIVKCPSYVKGNNIIGDILGLKKIWPNEETYLAFIHSKLLEYSMKACLYYHLCCVPTGYNYGNNSNTSNTATGTPSLHSNAASSSSTPSSTSTSPSLSSTPNAGRSGGVPASPTNITVGPLSGGKKTSGKYRFGSQNTPVGANDRLHLPGRLAQWFGSGRAGDTGSWDYGKDVNRSKSTGQIETIAWPAVNSHERQQAKMMFYKQQIASSEAKGDIAIIEYLAEVVKEQQSTEMRDLGGEGGGTPVIKLDYSSCNVHKNEGANVGYRGVVLPSFVRGTNYG
eukprot:TRINITY_DN2055_c0_g2_i1.p1 TRINITY_DN2055_c0_g2~~TRINITY_DN2055_c0_g2_i1.p1  ORF type:complete len:393 (-),score=106.22 TRINITY_DN2055_c0_g2_i1:34-1212(-)